MVRVLRIPVRDNDAAAAPIPAPVPPPCSALRAHRASCFSVPPPSRLGALEVNAAEPAVDAAAPHPVAPPVEDLAAAAGEGDLQRPERALGAGIETDEGAGGHGELAQEPMEGGGAQEGALLHRLRGAEEVCEHP